MEYLTIFWPQRFLTYLSHCFKKLNLLEMKLGCYIRFRMLKSKLNCIKLCKMA